MIERFIVQKLANNSIDKMLFIILLCLLVTSLNTLKYRDNNKQTKELINLIFKL